MNPHNLVQAVARWFFSLQPPGGCKRLCRLPVYIIASLPSADKGQYAPPAAEIRTGAPALATSVRLHGARNGGKLLHGELFGTRAGRHAGAREQRGRIAFGQAKAA